MVPWNISLNFFQRKKEKKMAHFPKLDEKHPYLAIAALRMSEKPEDIKVTAARVYWKFAAFHHIHKRNR